MSILTVSDLGRPGVRKKEGSRHPSPSFTLVPPPSSVLGLQDEPRNNRRGGFGSFSLSVSLTLCLSDSFSFSLSLRFCLYFLALPPLSNTDYLYVLLSFFPFSFSSSLPLSFSPFLLSFLTLSLILSSSV